MDGSCSSTSTVDSVSLDSAPPLPLVIQLVRCTLYQRPSNMQGAGWGVVLRGTTTELAEGDKIYTCHIEKVHHNSAAKDAGLSVGDQIVDIDGAHVKHMDHADVVKLFKSKEKVSLVILPARFKSCVSARITKYEMSSIDYIWALLHHLHTLEIININLDGNSSKCVHRLQLQGLLSVKRLAINYCSLTSLDVIEGLGTLQRLESLSLAHNFLSCESVNSCTSFQHLKLLKKLDMSRNLLNCLPEILCNMLSLEVLVLVENNISSLPVDVSKLTKLHTLCVDENLLGDVDNFLPHTPSIQKLTMAKNHLQHEPQSLKMREFLVTSVEGNPYADLDSKGIIARTEPRFHRTLSVRGQLVSSKKQIRRSCEWEGIQ